MFLPFTIIKKYLEITILTGLLYQPISTEVTLSIAG